MASEHDAYHAALVLQNNGGVCPLCLSHSGHYSFCLVFNTNPLPQAKAHAVPEALLNLGDHTWLHALGVRWQLSTISNSREDKSYDTRNC